MAYGYDIVERRYSILIEIILRHPRLTDEML